MPEINRGNFYEQYLTPGRGWAPGSNEAYNQQQSITETGGLAMPGPVPADVGLYWQDLHNQSVWNFQQRLLGASTGYLRGSLGDLQRFRPGGAAALQSGVYGQLSQNLMNRAAMTQPMDLLGDYRRHEAHQARKAAKKAALFSLGGQLAGAAIGAMAGGPAGAQMGAQTGGAIGTALGGGQTQLGPGPGTTNQQDPNALGQQQYAGPMAAPAQQPGSPWSQGQTQQFQQGMNQAMTPPGAAPSTLGPSGPPGGPGGQPGPGAPQGGPGGGGGQDEPQPGGGPQMGPGGGTMGFGAGGDFSPLTLAAMAAGEAYPEMPMVKLALQEHLVESLERDPDWQVLGYAVRNEALARGMVA